MQTAWCQYSLEQPNGCLLASSNEGEGQHVHVISQCIGVGVGGRGGYAALRKVAGMMPM